MAAVLSSVIPVWAQAQPVGGIRGLTYDKSFDVPVSGVVITIAETGKRVASQEQGNWVFPEVDAGTYTLIFTKDGFERQIKANVVVTAGQLTDLDVIRLAAEFEAMDEMVVQDLQPAPIAPLNLEPPPQSFEALQTERHEAPAIVNIIGSQEMQKAGASTAIDAVKYVSGASIQDGKYAVIRGLPDRYVNSQMNGIRLPTADLDKRAVALDQFPAAIVDQIKITKTFTPDQQGDASGGAVNVILKGVPNQTYLTLSAETKFNTQTQGRDDFLTYKGGGVNFLGKDDGGRDIPAIFQTLAGGDSDQAIGVSKRDAPLNSKWQFSGGIKQDLGDDYKIGGLLNLTYERNATSYRNGRDDQWQIDTNGHVVPAGFDPDTSNPQSLHLYDVSKSTAEVKWSELATVGIESKEQAFSIVHLYTRSAEDTAYLTQDVRGKQYIFPGYNPNDPNSPGFDSPLVAPWLRGESLIYRERTTETLQLHGRHTIPLADFGVKDVMVFTAPEFDWTYAMSSAGLNEPDKRQFGTEFIPGREIDLGPGVPPLVLPPTQLPYRPGSVNVNLGSAQQIWKDVQEWSTEYFVNLKFPFKQWNDMDGYFKFGVFSDDSKRTYRQDSFSNSAEILTGPHFNGPFNDFWSAHFPGENHTFTGALTDANYDGRQKIFAYYGMANLPLTKWLTVIGGLRFESTQLDTTIVDPEDFVFWVPPGSSSLVQLHPGDADVHFRQSDLLPSIGLDLQPMKELLLKFVYSETTARQTFKELTPIQQTEYLGGPIFVGNPTLKMSALKNYDFRADYTPVDGTFLSFAYFYKDVKNPIEYVQNSIGFTYTTPENYPKGKLSGVEFEVRQDFGAFGHEFEGLTLGGNLTLIQSHVTLPASEANKFTPALRTRDMTNAPAMLYNIFGTYDIKQTGTQLSMYYSVKGDTLIAGAGGGTGGIIIPSVYETEYGTLNFTLNQKVGDFVNVTFQAKNITNQPVQSVYRGNGLSHDVLKTSYTKGVDLSLQVGVKVNF